MKMTGRLGCKYFWKLIHRHQHQLLTTYLSEEDYWFFGNVSLRLKASDTLWPENLNFKDLRNGKGDRIKVG